MVEPGGRSPALSHGQDDGGPAKAGATDASGVAGAPAVGSSLAGLQRLVLSLLLLLLCFSGQELSCSTRGFP